MERSPAGMSSSASLNDRDAVWPRADGSAAASSAAVGLELNAVLSPSSSALRSSRESLCSEVRTSSSCTGVAVWEIFIVPPEGISGDARRARLEIDEEVALEEDARADLGRGVRWMGSADFLIAITSTAALVPSSGSIFCTLPTSTPAMRTGELGRIEFADWNCALST